MSFILKNIYQKTYLHALSFELPSKGFISIIGPNGSGKSSLMNILSSWHQPSHGEILWQHKILKNYSNHERAEHIAWLPQHPEIAWNLSVRDVVHLGGYAKRHLTSQAAFDDRVISILDEVGLAHHYNQKAHSLSGGEQALMHLARLIASDADCWLLDEFDAHLDWHHHLKMLHLLKKYSQNRLIICILHDLNMAQYFSDKVLLLHQGRLQAMGTAQEVMNAENLSNIWQTPIIKRKDGWLTPDISLLC